MDAFVALDRALDATRIRPALAPDVELVRFCSRFGGEHAVLRQPRSGCYYRLTESQADLAASLDGTRTVAHLAADPGGSGLPAGEAVELVEFLRRRGCLVQPSTDAFGALAQRCTRARTGRLGRAMTKVRAATVTVGGVPALTDFVYRHGGRWLFTRPAQAVLVPIIVVGLVLTITQRHQFTVLGQPTAATAATLWLLTLLALIIHELGHALAIRHAGRRILGAGFGLYFGNPVFFINSSDMVMARPRARAVNAAAGPVADFVVAGAAGIVAAWVGPTTVGELCYRFAVLTFVLAAVNLFPFLELDGYWLITDLLDVADLRPRAWRFLRRELVPRLRAGPRLSRGEWGLVGFGVAGAVATVGALVLAAVFWWPLLSAFIGGLWRSGWPGRCAVVLLAVLAGGPLAARLGDLAAGIRRWGAARRDAVRFWLQRRWRVAAAELVAALPQVDPILETELGDLAGRVQRRRFTAGHALVREGDAAAAFCVLRRGRCAVLETDRAGHESITGHLGAGDAFGDLALRKGTVQPVTVRAESAGEVFVIDAGTYLRLLADRLAPPPAPSQWPITRVRSLPPFRGLDPATLAELACAGSWLDVSPVQQIAAEDVRTAVYIVATGQLEALVAGRRVGILRTGDSFGADVAPANTPHIATVRTLTPVRLFRVPRATADRLLRVPSDLRPGNGQPQPPASATPTATQT